jgi:hypothetical protein
MRLWVSKEQSQNSEPFFVVFFSVLKLAIGAFLLVLPSFCLFLVFPDCNNFSSGHLLELFIDCGESTTSANWSSDRN